MLSCVLKKAGNNALKQQKDFDGDRKLVVDPSMTRLQELRVLPPPLFISLLLVAATCTIRNVHHVSARAFQSITNRMICPCTYSSSLKKGPVVNLNHRRFTRAASKEATYTRDNTDGQNTGWNDENPRHSGGLERLSQIT